MVWKFIPVTPPLVICYLLWVLIICSEGGQIATSVVTTLALDDTSKLFCASKKYYVLRTNIEDLRNLLSIAITGILVTHSVVWRKKKMLITFWYVNNNIIYWSAKTWILIQAGGWRFNQLLHWNLWYIHRYIIHHVKTASFAEIKINISKKGSTNAKTHFSTLVYLE